jgi:hypothetical protein
VGIASGKIPDFRAKNNPFKNKGFVPGKNWIVELNLLNSLN